MGESEFNENTVDEDAFDGNFVKIYEYKTEMKLSKVTLHHDKTMQTN